MNKNLLLGIYTEARHAKEWDLVFEKSVICELILH